MKCITCISLLILFATPFASAQDWAKAALEKSPRHREWVTVKHDGRSVETFVVYPESKGKTPVVLVIHEIFGMTDWVQDLADQVAAAGYIAVAPDLLSGMGPNGGRSSDFAEGKTMEAVSHLNPDQVTADLNAAADYALNFRPRVASSSLVDFAGVAVKLFGLRLTAAIWLPLLFSTAGRRRRTPWRASKPRSTGSMPGTMPASARPSRMPSLK